MIISIESPNEIKTTLKTLRYIVIDDFFSIPRGSVVTLIKADQEKALFKDIYGQFSFWISILDAKVSIQKLMGGL